MDWELVEAPAPPRRRAWIEWPPLRKLPHPVVPPARPLEPVVVAVAAVVPAAIARRGRLVTRRPVPVVARSRVGVAVLEPWEVPEEAGVPAWAAAGVARGVQMTKDRATLVRENQRAAMVAVTLLLELEDV